MTSSIYILIALQLVLNQSFNCSSAGSRRRVKSENGSDDVRASNVAAVKSVLLNVLGLKAEPDRSVLAGNNRQVVPDFMWQLYRRQLTENRQIQRQATEPISDRDKDHSRQRHQSDILRTTQYGGNTIRSFLATTQATPSLQDRDQFVANRIPVLPPDGDSSSDSTVRVSFNVSQSLINDVVYGAELRLCRHSTRSRQRRNVDVETDSLQSPTRYRISVYQVIQSSSADPIRRLLDTKVVSSKSSSESSSADDEDSDPNHWVSLDVSPAVATWKQLGHRSNLGLDIETSTLDGKPIDVERHVRVRRTAGRRPAAGRNDRVRETGPAGGRAAASSSSPSRSADDHENVRRHPVLVTYADDRRSVESTSKRKRSAAGGRSKDRKTSSNRPPSCRRRPLYVDFAEVEWNDWIVAPVGYQAFVCSGACPVILPDHLNATNHAQIQSLLHSVNRHVPAPCCVPTELSPISLLYFDETGTVVLRNYQDMVVDACGCR